MLRLTYTITTVRIANMEVRKTQEIEWLTVNEAVEMLPATSQRSVQNWVKAGVFQGAVKLPNGRWRIPRESVEAVLKNNEVPGDG